MLRHASAEVGAVPPVGGPGGGTDGGPFCCDTGTPMELMPGGFPRVCPPKGAPEGAIVGDDLLYITSCPAITPGSCMFSGMLLAPVVTGCAGLVKGCGVEKGGS
jgi:hypothetical protein